MPPQTPLKCGGEGDLLRSCSQLGELVNACNEHQPVLVFLCLPCGHTMRFCCVATPSLELCASSASLCPKNGQALHILLRGFMLLQIDIERDQKVKKSRNQIIHSHPASGSGFFKEASPSRLNFLDA